jgi:hypothetical protein
MIHENEEAFLKEALRDIAEQYRRAAQPFIDRLIELDSLRPPNPWLVHMNAKPVALDGLKP